MGSIVVIEAPTLGEGWLAVSRAILEDGAPATYDGQVTRELALLTLHVARPASDDELIARLGDPDWLAWMHANFFDPRGSGRDQLAWVVDRLRADPECRSATITTFEPLSDTAYIPCVSMLDFWAPSGRVELVVYAHSLDFGKKAYGNLVELARLQELVAGGLELSVGSLTMYVKSAHVYEQEWALMAGLVEQVRPALRPA